ncbi:hypothetical protein B9L19_08675 [Geobacillus thermocatenulatus]|uniref:Uncharacterized protein n=1 Tax=Geobacillus thermocatenulatus TaxID=33938 RepID=A0AA91TGF7_9BACL|nr:hypothetical protein B9L19_08675 [Geobacillus thermocatenulatus]
MEPTGWKVPRGKPVEPALDGRLCKHKPHACVTGSRGRFRRQKRWYRGTLFRPFAKKEEKRFLLACRFAGRLGNPTHAIQPAKEGRTR